MSTSGTHHDKAKKCLSDTQSQLELLKPAPTWIGLKIASSAAFSLLSMSQQALYIAQNTRDIVEVLEDVNETLKKR